MLKIIKFILTLPLKLLRLGNNLYYHNEYTKDKATLRRLRYSHIDNYINKRY